MKRNLFLAFAVIVLMAVIIGCASAEKKQEAALGQQRLVKYQRIALVCAPAPDLDASYAPMILKQAEAMSVSRLYFLEKVDCLYDVSVDTKTSPPRVKLGKRAQDYNGVVTMVYSYGGNMVNLDLDMIDVPTGQSVWHHQFQTEDPDLKDRLIKHGYWTPTTVKQHFYHYD